MEDSVKHTALLLAGLALAACSPSQWEASGVTPSPAPSDARVVGFGQLRPGARVRLAVSGVGRVDGQYRSVTPSTVVIETESRQMQFPVASVDSVWTRYRPFAEGAVAGAVYGGVAFGIAGAFFSSIVADILGRHPGPTHGFVLQVTLEAAGEGAVLGAAAGAAVGALLPGWRLRYP
jgi:hypothetical protein